MAKPAASDAALELYAALELAFTQFDEAHDWATLKFCIALVANDLDLMHELLTETETTVAWQTLLDPTTCPATCLPYLAQYVGARITPEMTEAEQRAAIANPEAFLRGTVAAIESVVKRFLTGTKYVKIEERYTGVVWRLRIVTLTGETPEPAALEAAIIREQKPVGILLFFNKIVAWTWGEIKVEIATYPTWLKLRESFATWLLVRTHE